MILRRDALFPYGIKLKIVHQMGFCFWNGKHHKNTNLNRFSLQWGSTWFSRDKTKRDMFSRYILLSSRFRTDGVVDEYSPAHCYIYIICSCSLRLVVSSSLSSTLVFNCLKARYTILVAPTSSGSRLFVSC